MAENEKTSKRIASIAARGIKDPGSLTKAEIKAVSATALTQTEDRPKSKSKAAAKPAPKAPAKTAPKASTKKAPVKATAKPPAKTSKSTTKSPPRKR